VQGFLAPVQNRKARQRSIAVNADKYADMFEPMTHNILAKHTAAVAAGTDETAIDWYRVANSICHQFAQDYSVNLDTVIQVMAVLSPSNSWARNIQDTGDMLQSGDCSHPYGLCIEYARRILQGEHLRTVVKRGRKVRSFYACIAEPDRPGPVCIDRHAVVLATGAGSISELDGWLDLNATYQLTAAAYRTAARSLSLLPSELQAITWTQHRIDTGADRHDTF